jgi:hypothetical protein
MNSERHLAIATAYIDLNPVRAYLVDNGTDYAWSTHRIHSGPPEPISRCGLTHWKRVAAIFGWGVV